MRSANLKGAGQYEIRAAFKAASQRCAARKSTSMKSTSKSTNGRRTGCQTRHQSCVSNRMRQANLQGASQGEVRAEFTHASRSCAGLKGRAGKGMNGNPRKSPQKKKASGPLGFGILR